MRKATHEERVRLAGEICNEVRNRLGEDLRAFVIYASVAKKEDVAYSDLEMMAVTSDRYEEHCAEFMRDGIRCEVEFIPLDSAIKQAGEITTRWPLAADQWHRFLALYIRNEDDCLDRIMNAASEVMKDGAALRKATVEMMLILYESMTKLMNSVAIRKVKSDIAASLFYVAKCSVDLVGLVNGHFYGGSRNSYEEAKILPDLPQDYRRLLKLVLGEVEIETQTRYNAALELWDNIKSWAAGQGIRWEEQSLEMPKMKEQ